MRQKKSKKIFYIFTIVILVVGAFMLSRDLSVKTEQVKKELSDTISVAQ